MGIVTSDRPRTEHARIMAARARDGVRRMAAASSGLPAQMVNRSATAAEAHGSPPEDDPAPQLGMQATRLPPFTVHDGLTVYRFGAGAPLLFMPYPHAVSTVGDGVPSLMALIERLVSFRRTVITFDPPGSGRSTRPLRLGMPEMLACAEEALAACGINGPVDVFGHSQG